MKYPPRLAILAKELNVRELLATIKTRIEREAHTIKVDDEKGTVAITICNNMAEVIITDAAKFNFTPYLEDGKHTSRLFVLTGKGASVSKATQAQLTTQHVPLMRLSDIKPINDCACSLMQFKGDYFCDVIISKLIENIFIGLTAELIIKFLNQLL